MSSQANFEVRFERANQQLAQTDLKVTVLVETQTEFIRTMLQHVEGQREINVDVRQTQRELARAQKTTQQEISDLTKIAGGLVRTVYTNGNPLQE